MPTRIVLGAQWGDEGKGKIVDLLSQEADYAVRYQGGANAGHTLKFDDTTVVLHLIPSGIFHDQCKCVIGNGVVIDPTALVDEIESLQEMGVELNDRLFISETAHVILNYHKVLDQVKETHRGDQAIGTTGRGIGPAYVSKVSRVGIRMMDLLEEDTLRGRVEQNLKDINSALDCIYGEEQLKIEPILEEVKAAAEKLRPYIQDTGRILHKALRENKQVLLEGAQGTMLDVDHGTYPYVTSSSPTSGGACVGTGIPPTAIDKVMGITKAYCTRVGNGPFPSELHNEEGERLRKEGHEFGATTGRPRRCGWIDLVALKYAVEVNGINELAITKMDVLDHFEELKVCTAYRLDGDEIDYFPLQLSDLEQVEPVYRSFEGWNTSTRDCQGYDELPEVARTYLDFIQEYIGVKLTILSNGPKRSETMVL